MTKVLLLGSVQRASSRIQHRGPPLRFGTQGLLDKEGLNSDSA